MNVYQTAANFNHTTHPYYNQHNLLISPSASSSVYSAGQLLNDDHFYTNMDNTNHSLIHMFINNEPKLDQKTEFYPNSSFTSFSSPSPSSSYNSSNGSGQMVIGNWTPNSQTGQEEQVVLCQLDELTKSLNNQMNEPNNCKKNKIITRNLDVTYNNATNLQTQIELDQQLALTNYESNLFNNCIPPHQINESQLLTIQQHQFNTDMNLIQQHHQQLRPSQLDSINHNISHLPHSILTDNSSPVLASQSINLPTALPSNNKQASLTSNNTSLTQLSSTTTYTPALSTMRSSNIHSMQGKLINIQPIPAINQQLDQSQQTGQLNFDSKIVIKKEPNNNSTAVATAANNHLLNAIIGYDSQGRPMRNNPNKKERRRTLSINAAFSNLRECIPNVPADTKLSKIKTLRLATSYISYLMELLDDSSPINGKRNRLMMTCEDFKVDLQRFKGRSKNIQLIYPKFSDKFNDKQFTRKSNASSENVDNQNNSYLVQQARMPTSFHAAAGEMKSNICTNQAIHSSAYNQVMPTLDSLEHYDQTSKRIKGRTGWPQHVIKHVWQSELQETTQI